eukprot:1613587-Rhodomonas_salina.4
MVGSSLRAVLQWRCIRELSSPESKRKPHNISTICTRNTANALDSAAHPQTPHQSRAFHSESVGREAVGCSRYRKSTGHVIADARVGDTARERRRVAVVGGAQYCCDVRMRLRTARGTIHYVSTGHCVAPYANSYRTARHTGLETVCQTASRNAPYASAVPNTWAGPGNGVPDRVPKRTERGLVPLRSQETFPEGDVGARGRVGWDLVQAGDQRRVVADRGGKVLTRLLLLRAQEDGVDRGGVVRKGVFCIAVEAARG